MTEEADGQDPHRGERALVEFLRTRPAAIVFAVGPGRRLVPAEPLLRELGFPDHRSDVRGLPSDYVTPADVHLISRAGQRAAADGRADCAVHLRSGELVTLTLFRLARHDVVSVFAMGQVDGQEHPVDLAHALRSFDYSLNSGLILCNDSGIIVEVDEWVRSLIGRPRDAVVGVAVIEFIHPDDLETSLEGWNSARANPGVPVRFRGRILGEAGAHTWIEAILTSVTEDGVDRVQIELHDVSSEVAAQEALLAEKDLISQLTQSLPVGVAKFDPNGRLEYQNDRLDQLVGGRASELVPALVHPRSEVAETPLALAFAGLLNHGVDSRLVVEQPRMWARFVEWSLNPVKDQSGSVVGGVLCVSDVTEAHELRARLEHQAVTDPLTGCLNRAGTLEVIEAGLSVANLRSGIGALFVDLDDLKLINDTHGHAAGDEVLAVVVRRLSSAIRPGDAIGRIGGDEFVVVAPKVPSASVADDLGARITGAVSGVALVGGQEIEVSISVGVAWACSGSADELLERADRAMYAQKQARRTQRTG